MRDGGGFVRRNRLIQAQKAHTIYDIILNLLLRFLLVNNFRTVMSRAWNDFLSCLDSMGTTGSWIYYGFRKPVRSPPSKMNIMIEALDAVNEDCAYPFRPTGNLTSMRLRGRRM